MFLQQIFTEPLLLLVQTAHVTHGRLSPKREKDVAEVPEQAWADSGPEHRTPAPSLFPLHQRLLQPKWPFKQIQSTPQSLSQGLLRVHWGKPGVEGEPDKHRDPCRVSGMARMESAQYHGERQAAGGRPWDRGW